MIELKLRCDSKAHFDAWAAAKGLTHEVTDLDGKPQVAPIPGVQFVEIGQIVQKPAVYGNGFDQPATVAAVIDTAYHVDVRIFSPNLYIRDTAERNGYEVELAEDYCETITKDFTDVKPTSETDTVTAIESNSLGAEFVGKTERIGRMIGDVKLAPAIYDVATGVSICFPATSRHEWC